MPSLVDFPEASCITTSVPAQQAHQDGINSSIHSLEGEVASLRREFEQAQTSLETKVKAMKDELLARISEVEVRTDEYGQAFSRNADIKLISGNPSEKASGTIRAASSHYTDNHGSISDDGLHDVQIAAVASKGSAFVNEPSVLSRAVWRKELLRMYHNVEYEFQESLWDTVVFLGTPALGLWELLSLSTCLLANFAAQILLLCVFCWVPNSFLHNHPPSVQEIEKWRTSDAHDEKYSDFTKSMGQRVCDMDASLSFATGQLDLTYQIDDYLARLVVDWLPMGWLLTSVLLSFWTLILFQEIRNIMDFLCAFSVLPKGKTILTIREDSVAIKSLHTVRFCMVVATSVVRFCICCTLLVVGSLWLGSTWNIEDLVLNTAALEFTISIDELLYMTVAPAMVKTIVKSLEPLPLPKQKPPHSLIGIVLAISLVTTMGLTKLDSNLVRLQALNETMCGGRQNFVFMKQTTTSELKWAHHPEPEEYDLSGSEIERKTTFDAGAFYAGLVRTVINDNEDAFVEALPTRKDLFTLGQMTANQLVVFSECVDRGTTSENDFDFFKALTENASISSCDHLIGYCSMPGWSSVNAFCPVTCGCSSPRSGLLVYDGCPPECYKSQSNWEDVACEDLTLQAIFGDPSLLTGWVSWWTKFAVLTMVSQFNTSSLDFTTVPYGGCSEVTRYQSILCNTGDFADMFGSLHFWCPVACGCLDDAQRCPSRCTSSGGTR